jgi:hypothetical protein
VAGSCVTRVAPSAAGTQRPPISIVRLGATANSGSDELRVDVMVFS